MGEGILHPSDVVFVPSLQVARGVIVDKFLSIIALTFVLSHLHGLFQPADDGFDGIPI